MKYSESVKPISYLKSRAAEVIREVTNQRKTMIITQNGEAKVVVQDVRAYEEMRESMAFLKMVAQGKNDVRSGRVKGVKSSFRNVRKRTCDDL